MCFLSWSNVRIISIRATTLPQIPRVYPWPWLIQYQTTMSKKAHQIKRSNSKNLMTDTCSFHAFTPAEIDDLRKSLLSWYDTDQRDLPWRKVDSSDPNVKAYSVWVSEVMLQQTQVATVIDYYNRWMKKWPTVQDLAAATVEEVNTMWSGLGYYSRGRSLLEAAQKVVSDMEGEMPRTAEELQRLLTGVGRYTAGAVASIAFSQVTGLVDGNVMRVLSRLRLIGSYITQRNVVDTFWSLANQTVDPQRPGDFNQSVMELGATICTPKTPSCSRCPVKALCHAYTKANREHRPIKGFKSVSQSEHKVEIPDIENTVPDCGLCLPADQKWDGSVGVVNLPRKPPKVKAKQEDLYALVIKRRLGKGGDQYWMVRRPDKGLLAGLWEFPVRSWSGQEVSKKLDLVVAEDFGLEERVGKVMDCGQVTHMFSHIHHTYHVISLDGDNAEDMTGLNPDGRDSQWISEDQMMETAISTGMRKVFKLFQDSSNPQRSKSSRKRPREDGEGESSKSQPSISAFFKPAKGKL